MKSKKTIQRIKIVSRQLDRLSPKMRLMPMVWISSLSIVMITALISLYINMENAHRSLGSVTSSVKLAYFKADLTRNAVTFSWATDAEYNNEYFTIERSADGIQFRELSKQPGAGNSNTRRYYSDMDESMFTGYTFYRLKQTDSDGNSSYSEIRTIKYKADENVDTGLRLISITPNPFSEELTVQFILKASESVTFMLINSAGQIACKEKINSIDGMNQYHFIDRNALPPGMYFAALSYHDKIITQKIIKD